MNKILPIILVVVIVLGVIVGGAYYFFKKSIATPVEQTQEIEEIGLELSLEEKPYASLTPRADGHELHLSVTRLSKDVATVEYDLFYTNADGVKQGATGSGKTNSSTKLERDILLGSCSSGKCKYDEGVEEGTFVLKLRDVKGKLISKMQTDFHLQKASKDLASSDGVFHYTSSVLPTGKAFYLVMNTFGVPSMPTGAGVKFGPYGVFSSGKAYKGNVAINGNNGNLYGWNGTKWVAIDPTKDDVVNFFGVFVTTTF